MLPASASILALEIRGWQLAHVAPKNRDLPPRDETPGLMEKLKI
jgi:hypothetical protein